MKKEAGIVILLVLLLFVWSCASTPPIDQITADGSTNESEGGESEAADSIESGSETDQPSNLGESPATVNASGTASGANNPGECGGWRCISSKTKIYQNPDCTFGERKDCYYEQNLCNPLDENPAVVFCIDIYNIEDEPEYYQPKKAFLPE